MRVRRRGRRRLPEEAQEQEGYTQERKKNRSLEKMEQRIQKRDDFLNTV